MNKTRPQTADLGKLLYKLVVQFLIFSRGRHKLLEPHLLQISRRLKSGANLGELSAELHAISKTLLHISKQEEPNKTGSAEMVQNEYLLRQIDQLLVDTSVPLRFQQRTVALRRKIKVDIDDEAFNQIIDLAIALLCDIRNYAASEQQDIDLFLTDLTEQLSEIEQHAELVGQSARLSMNHREEFNTEINLHLDNIKGHASQAEELAALKVITSEHLERLMSQLLAYKQQEDERQREAEEQIALMTAKLQSLETETEALRSKLRIEHDRALCDALTCLPNRLAYEDRVEIEANRWRRYRTPLSLAIWDIDYFKRINDNYGHKAGDKTLVLIGQLLKNSCRETDFVARYGGEEFLMLLPSTTASEALAMAESIRETVESCGFNHNGENVNLTICCGISEFGDNDLHDDVFIRADMALYQAKQAGRNRCETYTSDLGSYADNDLTT